MPERGNFLQSPYPYFGGKSKVADVVWKAFGKVDNYVEPFFGSGAVLLSRPGGAQGWETINDIDGFIVNFWRAVKHAPEEVAWWADYPVSEQDLHARHAWLVQQRKTLLENLEDPHWFDAKIAGWWVWGMGIWIGGGFCSGEGPWVLVDGRLRHKSELPPDFAENGVSKRIPYLRSASGIHKKSLKLQHDFPQEGVNKKIPVLRHSSGIHKKSLTENRSEGITNWMLALSERMRNVRICCGDWKRILTKTPTTYLGLTAVFLDPPYSDKAGREEKIYTCESLTVAHDVRQWCIENGDNPMFRIALCGYEGEHKMPDGWTVYKWETNGGFANQGQNKARENKFLERIWFSPHCLPINDNVNTQEMLINF